MPSIEPVSVLNFNGYQVESGAIINTFPSSSKNLASGSGSGSGFDPGYEELTLMCSGLTNDDTVDWMVINFSNNDSFINETVLNRSSSSLTVRISKGELTVACISEGHNESINVTITTGE